MSSVSSQWSNCGGTNSLIYKGVGAGGGKKGKRPPRKKMNV